MVIVCLLIAVCMFVCHILFQPAQGPHPTRHSGRLGSLFAVKSGEDMELLGGWHGNNNDNDNNNNNNNNNDHDNNNADNNDNNNHDDNDNNNNDNNNKRETLTHQKSQ